MRDKKVILLRTSKSDTAIYGVLMVVYGDVVDFICRTIENKTLSFPAGTYKIVYEYSPKFKQKLWELKKVTGRAEIKIHVANYWKQLLGCVGIGNLHQDINADGEIDIAESKKALTEFHMKMSDRTESKIIVIEQF